MSIPLDNLYHWVESLVPAPVVLYVFHPHGSKKISDFNWLWNYLEKYHNRLPLLPAVIFNDQEPLDWNLYNCPQTYLSHESYIHKGLPQEFWHLRNQYYSNFNLKSMVYLRSSQIYDNVVLVHSEKNSRDLTQYEQNGFVSVHYWAHAIIARDWYRFAEYDTRLAQSTIPQNKFLIYCRDWSHRREYRLKFLEMLAINQLANDSMISVMHTNSDGIHYSQHKFSNPDLDLTRPEIISQFENNNLSSTTSADYDYLDFITTEISVVLETVFDDSRIHLTEKTLRPIACGHPFILAAGPGALEYVRSYGFKTFAPWIDESYDSETNSVKRLEKIIQAMKKIQNLQGQELEEFSQAIKAIADYNKNHFFSDEFSNMLTGELKNNLSLALDQVSKSQGKNYLGYLKQFKQSRLQHNILQRREKTLGLRQLRQAGRGSQSSHQTDPLA